MIDCGNNMENFETMFYGFRLNNESDLLSSSSGGAFTALSNYVLENGGTICASIYDYNSNCLRFELLDSLKKRNAAKGSKYIQSKIGNIFVECRKWVYDNSGKFLLFIGTGCQADGFRIFSELAGIRDSVIIVDLICHGVASPVYWREYTDLLGRIEYLSFKDKRNGWNRPYSYARVNGKEITLNEFMNIYYSGCSLRPSCHSCRYSRVNRKVDITIGDYWHVQDYFPEHHSTKGISLIIVHTKKGKEVFDRSLDGGTVFVSSENKCMQPNLLKPSEISVLRGVFWKRFVSKGVGFSFKRYGRKNKWYNLLNKIEKVVLMKSIYSKKKGKYPYPTVIKDGVEMMVGVLNNGSAIIRNTDHNTGSSKDKLWKMNIPVLYERKEDCCGCAACYSICPKKAIIMFHDEEGFEYPSIDAKKCIICGQCIKICPIKNADSGV